MKQLETEMQALGDELVDKIKERTLGGKDVSGRPFKKYSEEYKKKKLSLGYPAYPNIKLSGETQDAIKAKVKSTDTKVELTIEIEGDDLKQRAAWVSQTRKFFGLSQKDAIKIDKLLNKIFRRK